MKIILKRLAIMAILGVIGQGEAFSQATMAQLRKDPTKAGCLFHSYEFHEISDTKPPKGYKPFYISHYGRHGSRHHTLKSYYEDAVLSMHHADSIGNLTAEGKYLKTQLDSLYQVHEGMHGELTRKGAEEQKKLAKRMYSRFPEVFTDRHRNTVDTYSSDITRCILSLASFTGSLISCNPDLNVLYETGKKCSEYLRCGTAAGPIKKHYEPFMHKSIDDSCDWTAMLERLFKDPSLLNCSPYDFASDLWGAWAICQCVESVHIDIFKYYTEEQLYNTWKYRSLYYHQIFVRSDLFPEVAVSGVKGLLKDIIVKADAALAGEETAATIRFGHDSTLMPLAGLIGIDGFDKAHCENDPITEKWDLGTHVCMGSSLQMIFYRNKKGNILVKFLYNEKEKSIPALTPYAEGFYYDWDTLRTHLNRYAL